MRRFQFVFVMFLLSETLGAAAPSSAARPEAVPTAPAGSAHRSFDGGSGRAAVREISTESVKNIIQQYLEGEWSQRVKEVHVAVLDPSDPIKIPPGHAGLRVVPGSNDERMGRRMFQLAVTVNGKPWKTIEVLADITATIDVVSLNRSVKSEELIGAEDVKIASVRIHQLNHPFITDQEEAIGKGAARPLQADTALRPLFLKKPLIVKKGDRVIIEARRGGLSIHTYGVTKSNGYLGETIMVVNVDSGRELRGKIVASGLVQVEF